MKKDDATSEKINDFKFLFNRYNFFQKRFFVCIRVCHELDVSCINLTDSISHMKLKWIPSYTVFIWRSIRIAVMSEGSIKCVYKLSQTKMQILR